jgi:hypothetical protein
MKPGSNDTSTSKNSVENTKERSLCNETLTEETMILKFILKKRDETSWIGFMWHRANTNSGAHVKR